MNHKINFDESIKKQPPDEISEQYLKKLTESEPSLFFLNKLWPRGGASAHKLQFGKQTERLLRIQQEEELPIKLFQVAGLLF